VKNSLNADAGGGHEPLTASAVSGKNREISGVWARRGAHVLDTLTDLMTSAIDPVGLAEGSELDCLRAGDLAVLGRVYDEHHAAVRTFARRLLGDEAAEDLVHDTFLSLPRALRRFNGESSLRTFILGVAVNHARHHVRGSARRRLAMARFADEPRAAQRSQEDLSEQQRLSALLLRALDRLSFDHRTAFVLCEVEERSSPEVASILGIPEATVRTRLHHARQKLRAWLEKEGVR
jgi:RNA polymerase sigma-70 factor (ECF subfamily)